MSRAVPLLEVISMVIYVKGRLCRTRSLGVIGDRKVMLTSRPETSVMKEHEVLVKSML